MTLPPSLCAPAVRMAVVTVYVDCDESNPDGWKTEVDVLPVLALAARPGEGVSVDYQPLIVSPDPTWGIIPADYLNGYCLVWQIVACPWSAEEDEARLAGLKHDLETRAVREAGERLERKALRESATQGVA